MSDMGLSVTFAGAPDGGDGPFDLATASGWSLFASWAESLPEGEFSAVRELADAGTVKGTDRLSAELHHALTTLTPPPAVSHTALLLLGNIGVGDQDETATVTDGDPPEAGAAPGSGGGSPPPGGDVTTPGEMAEIADILAHVYGPGQALALFDAPAARDRVREFWDQQEHPRGPGGRFVVKGTAAAYAAARQNLADALRKPGTPESHQELVGHLAKLNVSQLHALKAEYGVSASAPNKAALVDKLADRLNRGRREGGAGAGAKSPAPEPGPPAVKPPRPQPTGAVKPILPGRPIAERLAAYTEGDAIVKRLAARGAAVDRAAEAYRTAAATHAGNENKLMAAQKRLNEVREGAKAKDVNAARKEFAEAGARYRETLGAGRKALADLGAAKETARAAVAAELKAAHPTEFTGTVGFTGPARSAVNDGRRWLGSITGAGPEPEVAVDFEPNRGADGGAHSDRAHATADGTKVRLGGHEDAGAVVHELGHVIEARVPGAARAAQEFLAHRVGGEAVTPMRDKFGQGYQGHELGRKDQFDRHFGERHAYYVGKQYALDDGRVYATEITSMGAEALYRDGARFAKADPEFCKFTVGILTGALRSHG